MIPAVSTHADGYRNWLIRSCQGCLITILLLVGVTSVTSAQTATLTEADAAVVAAGEADAGAAALKAALSEVRQATLDRLKDIEQQFGAIEPRLGGTDEQLKLLQTAIDENQKALDSLGKGLDSGLAGIDPIRVRLDGLATGLERVNEQLKQHETRLEDNGLKLFETLMGIDNSGEELAALRARLNALSRGRSVLPQDADEATADTTANTTNGEHDDSGLLLALVLGLAFPIGVILYLGVGSGAEVRMNAIGCGLVPWLAGGTGYVLIGFGLMFGSSQLGLIGLPLDVLPALLQVGGTDQVLSESLRQLSMQLPLAGAASLLFCSAVAGRLSPGACLLAALIMGALLYPLVGHWTMIASGVGGAAGHPIGWLAVAGLSDAGDAIGLAALAGVGSLALAWGLRPAGQTVSRAANADAAADTGGALIAVGTLMLWAAWLVSVLATGADGGTVPWLALASAAAAAGAALAVVLVGLLRSDERSWEQRLPGGLLAGVLAASAAYALAGVLLMLLLGLVTGALYALSSSAVRRRLGSAADLALVFAIGGVSGALAPGLFGPEGLIATGVLAGLLTQALGLAVVSILAIVAGTLIALALRALPGSWLMASS